MLWLRWDQASNRFSEFDAVTGTVGHAFLAGSKHRLVTPAAQLFLADTSVVPGGPDAPDVTLNLSLAFKPRVAGRTLLIEAAASDDLGNQEEFEPVGTATVAPAHMHLARHKIATCAINGHADRNVLMARRPSLLLRHREETVVDLLQRGRRI